VPQGLPSFALPVISYSDLSQVRIGGCAVAMMAFADTSVLSRTHAARTRTLVDPNQEMIGLGVANLAGGFFQGFQISSSPSRTPVAEAAGAKTQLTGVAGAVAVAAHPVFAPNLLKDLPNSALAAVVIAAAIDFADLRRILRIQAWEFCALHRGFVGVAVFGVVPGIGIASSQQHALSR
jgi:MFS superfamily sulfate permease-like transporter